MSLSINTNTAALIAHRSMVSTDKNMTTSLTRLSTGLRINSAADDASGLTIANSLAAQAAGIGQGIQNANDGVSIVQTADGALKESVSIVNTIKTKATQAASDSQTTTTRTAIQEDIDKLLEELDSIATSTSYNGMQLLNGTYTNKVIHTGASANESSSISIGNTESDSIGHISTATLALDDQEGSTVELTITSAITGEDIHLEPITIEANNEEANGLGALADKINAVTSSTGVSAVAVVESTSEYITEGSTGSNFAINGVTIGAIDVKNGDSDSSLVTAINDQTSETGVSAAWNEEGTITLTSNDGRAISVTGDLNDVFGEGVEGEALSTVGYITLTQEGSSQFNITATTSGGTGDKITLGDDFTATGESTIAKESIIQSGSVLAAGSVLGGEATVKEIKDTTGDFKLEAGTTLVSGSVLAKGTVIAGEVTTSAKTTLTDDMTVSVGTTLESGSTLAKGTVVTQTFSTDDGAGTVTTYEAGSTLTADVNLTSDLTITKEMTLAEDSILTSGSVLTAGTKLGADVGTSGNAVLSGDMTLETGSTIASGSTLTAGSVLGNDTTIKTGTTLTVTEDMEIAAGSEIASGSTIAKGSHLSGAVTVGTIDDGDDTTTGNVLSEDMTLEAGSTLTSTTTLKAGTTLVQAITVTDPVDSDKEITYTAGSTLTNDVKLTGTEVTLSEDMTLEKGSTIGSGSELQIATQSGDVSLADQKGMTLADISVMTQEDAEIAIAIADAALADLDAIRSGLGSAQNQLTSTISNLSVTKTNVTASESTIRDVDFAEETANYAKLSLLAQTSSYALSQANASSSNITSLLR
ncbi:flagellin [Desulfobacter vibrioformis]|uniref:flagellin N-terminal helical domain-containing protein n=1 Tax=Desulfobacter vibrioformis TaxID=34031 RepID=UPI0005563CEF|nr:flagellin [Desulfobacter vibrioformis]